MNALTFEDSARDNSNVLAADSELSIAIPGGTNVEIDVLIFVDAGDGGFQVALDPGSATFVGLGGTIEAVGTESWDKSRIADIADLVEVGDSGQLAIHYQLLGKSDNEGTLSVNWAQLNASAEPTVRKRSSRISVTELV